MACNQVRELVFGHACAIVLTTGERKFERFVESQRYCQPVDEVSTYGGHLSRHGTIRNAGSVMSAATVLTTWASGR